MAPDLTNHLTNGNNELLVLALGLGVGTEAYCPAEAGVNFRTGPGLAKSRQRRPDRSPIRSGSPQRTVRRWIMPCIEDYDATAKEEGWAPATIVEKTISLYPRRVPFLHVRYSRRNVLFWQKKCGSAYWRSLSVFAPTYTDGEQKHRCNEFSTPAYLVTDIHSPIDQSLTFTPALGQVSWYFHGRKLFDGRGWRCSGTKPPVRIELKRGANRLIGLHDHRNHFEDINLAGSPSNRWSLSTPLAKGDFRLCEWAALKIWWKARKWKRSTGMVFALTWRR